MKLEEFKAKPKRKYVRKNLNENINSYNINSVEEDTKREEDIINHLDNIINKDKDEDENLCKSLKKMKIEEDNISKVENNFEILTTINRAKISKREVLYYNPNVINVNNYEFLSNVKVYLYYVSEKLGTNVIKYLFYSHIHKHIDHHIICAHNEIPPNPKCKVFKIIEEEVILNKNVTLYVKEFCSHKQNYTYEMCNNNLNRKRKKDIDFNYEFCQIYLNSVLNNHKNSYVFEYDGKYISFEYNIYKNIETVKLLTNN